MQKSPEGVIHLMTTVIHDRTAELGRLSDTHVAEPALSRADEAVHPTYPRPSGHPRTVRVMPKSRDFH